MFDANSDAKAAYMQGNRQYVTLTVTETDGETTHTLTEANIVEGGFTIDNYCATASRLEVGTAVAAQLTVSFFNADGELDAINFKGAEILVEHKVKGIEYAYDTFYGGVFTVDTVIKRGSVITVTAYDNMTKLDKLVGMSYEAFYSANGDVTITQTGRVYTRGTFGWLFHLCCVNCGVYIKAYLQSTDLRAYFSDTFCDTAITDIQNMANLTYRTILMNLCALAVGVAVLDGQGNMTVTAFRTIGYLAYGYESSEVFASEVDLENTQSCKGICYTTASGTKVALRPDTYAQNSKEYINADRSVISYYQDDATEADYDNPDHGNLRWEQYRRASMASYIPFSAKVMPSPFIQPADMITLPAMENLGSKGIVTHITYHLNGATEISGTEQINDDTSTTSDYTWQGSQTGQSLAALEARVTALENGSSGSSSNNIGYPIGLLDGTSRSIIGEFEEVVE